MAARKPKFDRLLPTVPPVQTTRPVARYWPKADMA